MVISGVFLKANEARIVTLSGTKENHTLIAAKFNKLSLPKNPTQEDVKIFVQTFQNYCSDHNINKVVINRRATKGQGAGGAGTFLLEGIILAISPASVEFAHPATIRATDRRDAEKKAEKPKTIDLGKAYDYAFEELS